MQLKLKAPAKINLSLRILGRRPDGFHELESIVTKLPWLSDELSIECLAGAPTDHFVCTEPSLPLDDSNLVLRALASYRAAGGQVPPLNIHLHKNIPHGAGLGGGSSDAATMLQGLQQLASEPLAEETIVQLAAELGSDVPLFLCPHPVVRITGRGEMACPYPAALPPLHVLLLKPSFAVATAEAYRNCLKARALPGLELLAPRVLEGTSLVLQNDLEAAVFAKHRYLAELLLELTHQPEVRCARMSGSGSTVFALLESAAAAAAVGERLRLQFDPTLWLGHGPLHSPSRQ